MADSTSLCKHFGDCGGCLHQDLSYEDQLKQKAALLQALFQEVWESPIPMTPSPVIWQYRNKVDPSFALKRYPEPPPPGFERETVLGFKRRGKWFWPLDIEECRIGPAGLDRLLQGTRTWMKTCDLRACEPRRERGYLRNLLVRDGKRSGERMVVLITRPGAFQHADTFVSMARECFHADSIYHGEFAGRAEVATADTLTLLHGQDVIHEQLLITDDRADNTVICDTPAAYIAEQTPTGRRLSFRISPLSFFQTNPLAAERLYGHIRAWAARLRPGTLFDLYGGSGGIALSCADCAGEIISVENVAAATEDGRRNAQDNTVDNVLFVADSVRNFLRQKVEGNGLPTDCAVVLDPPRAGMHPKAIKRLLRLQPRHFLYVSCNPKRLRTELPDFLEAYHLEGVQAVDMFPHTPHVEVLAAFTRK